jgi:hypothetical protein
MRFEPYPEGFEPPRPPLGGLPPQPPLERVVPVERELEVLGRRCFVTSLESWRDAFVVRYTEFTPPTSSAEAAGREDLIMQEFLIALRGLGPQNREEVLRALSDLDNVEAVEQVLEALRGKHRPERQEILEAMREAGEKTRREGQRRIPEAFRHAAHRGSFERGALAGPWEAHDDVGVSYREVGGGSTGTDYSREGSVGFNPSLSPTAEELILSPHDMAGRPLGRISVPLLADRAGPPRS